MATHRTKPNTVQHVTAIPAGALAEALGCEPHDYIVADSYGMVRVIEREPFEREFEPIPPPSALNRYQVFNGSLEMPVRNTQPNVASSTLGNQITLNDGHFLKVEQE